MAYTVRISLPGEYENVEVKVPDGTPVPDIRDPVGFRTHLPRPVRERWFAYDDRDKETLTIYLKLEPRGPKS